MKPHAQSDMQADLCRACLVADPGIPACFPGPRILAIKQSSPGQEDILPAKGLAQNLLAAPLLQELHLCTLHLLHPSALRSALVKLRLLRVLVLDYVEAYEKVTSLEVVPDMLWVEQDKWNVLEVGFAASGHTSR